MTANAVVVATGGLSIPKIGATDIGYRIAEQFGLRIEAARPALVPLVLDETDRRAWCDLSGVAAEVEASAGGARFREKMLITHRGLSGPAVLQASSYSTQELTLDLLPGHDFAAEVQTRRAAGEKAAVKTMLAGHLPRRLAERWIDVHGEAAGIAKLHRWRVRPAGTEGYEKAEVTAGGVSTEELSSKTMESRNVPGLFFIGEVVDVTGHLGGFNFQWAWASGYAAGQAV